MAALHYNHYETPLGRGLITRVWITPVVQPLRNAPLGRGLMTSIACLLTTAPQPSYEWDYVCYVGVRGLWGWMRVLTGVGGGPTIDHLIITLQRDRRLSFP